MSYRLSERAFHDLQAVYQFSVDRFGERQADRYFANLLSSLETIALFPELGRVVFADDPPVRVVPKASHIIAYRVHADDVRIIRILDQSEDWLDKIG